MMKIDEILRMACVIPVLEISDLESAAPLAEALAKGGLQVVELTLRTECALQALALMKNAVPGLIVGMGTVRTEVDVTSAVEAGADFLVTPGASASLLSVLATADTPVLPGICTASEAMSAFEKGFGAMKFFPAEPAGGIAVLKSFAGPLPDIVFCPTGGISAEKAPQYLALSNVACVGGSWIANKDSISQGDWDHIELNARKAVDMSS